MLDPDVGGAGGAGSGARLHGWNARLRLKHHPHQGVSKAVLLRQSGKSLRTIREGIGDGPAGPGSSTRRARPYRP